LARKVVAIGEILVEIMATSRGDGFREPIGLIGPFPSGAPAIFIDQVGKQGVPCAMVGAVGDDDFGRLNLDRLRRDGVDVSAVTVDPEAATGSAFVRYREDGGRNFVFNIAQSASGRLTVGEAARSTLASATHLHVVGSSLGVPALASAVLDGVEIVKAAGGTISFDPNVRREMLGAPGFRTALMDVLARADLVLPSDGELPVLADAGDDEAAVRQLLDRGVAAIVHKQGARGARYIDRNTDLFVPAFSVTEVDPTGAGDIFGATFLTGWLGDLRPADNLRRAVAAGALAVTRQGPMEGASTPAEIDAFLARAATR